VGVNPFLALSSATDWFDAAQSLMLDALEGVLSLDEMDARLSELAPAQIPLSKPSDSDLPVVCETLGWRLGLPDPLCVPQVMPGLLHRALTEVLFAYSLWWSEGSERVAPSLLVCQGLPPDPAFTTLYTGDWSAGRWWNLEDRSEQHRSEGG
jgi:type VI secretion system protein ImpM